MTLHRTLATANKLCSGADLNTQFNLCFLYIYSGAMPATADEALNVVSVHTELVKISNNSTATGLTWDTPTTGAFPKKAAETWSGVNTFSGLNSALTTDTPLFYRLCAAGDNGRAAANATTGYRIQGSVGGPSSGADLEMAATTMTAGVTTPIGGFSIAIAN